MILGHCEWWNYSVIVFGLYACPSSGDNAIAQNVLHSIWGTGTTVLLQGCLCSVTSEAGVEWVCLVVFIQTRESGQSRPPISTAVAMTTIYCNHPQHRWCCRHPHFLSICRSIVECGWYLSIPTSMRSGLSSFFRNLQSEKWLF